MRSQEFTPRKLVIFDIDDTLVHTQTKVHVVKDGQVINSLNSHNFTHYKLQDGEKFDFGDFANAKEFFNNAKPIIPMLDQLKQDIATGNKVVMVTARADFDDRELFLDTFRKYGVDMGKVHVYRAGNMQGKMQTEEKKKIIIRDLLNNGNYTKAIMYDDAVPNLESFVELKDEYPQTKFYAWNVSLEGEASEYHRTNETLAEDQDDYEIRNYKKLDKILSKLCALVVEGQKINSEFFGNVAAAVLDPDNNLVARLNRPGQNGKRIHAERAAMEAYEDEYGDIPQGSIVITTCSPCSEHMIKRDGDSCTDYINNSTVKKVYCGYSDPTQDEEQREFSILETRDAEIRELCKIFAETFIHGVNEDQTLEERKKKRKPRRAAYGPGLYGGYGYFSNYGNSEGGDGGGDGGGESIKNENFADGKNPQDKGDSKRHGVPTKASVSTLRKVAKQGGRKGQLAHWMANMKAGKAKKK